MGRMGDGRGMSAQTLVAIARMGLPRQDKRRCWFLIIQKGRV